ncbi:hypothetical protein llap_2374 [Limosa lapponica baueri]|uniref:Uncharacterized protein n=1 Tax=Limosa lapponica baueri TaxID=1758121 RepID=A0A2I0UMS9_LIMLA|nr:hypothetical protein llap_2374 [Limosa lapponica baueri]
MPSCCGQEVLLHRLHPLGRETNTYWMQGAGEAGGHCVAALERSLPEGQEKVPLISVHIPIWLQKAAACGAGMTHVPPVHEGYLAQQRAAAMYGLQTLKPILVQAVVERCQASEKVYIRQPLPET